MLVITRKKGESILIGDDIEIIVVKMEDGSVKLAINAPRSISILRKELYAEVQKENINAINYDIDVLKNMSKK